MAVAVPYTDVDNLLNSTAAVKAFAKGTATRFKLASDGTMVSQAENVGALVWDINPDPLYDTLNPAFRVTAASFDNASGHENFVVRMGHNRTAGGLPINASYAQNCDEWESSYLTGGKRFCERHLIVQGTYGAAEQRWLSAYIRTDAAPSSASENSAGFAVDQVLHLDRSRAAVFQSDSAGFRHEYGGTFKGTLRQETGSGQALTAEALGVGAFGVWQSYFTAGGSLQVIPHASHTPTYSATLYQRNATTGSLVCHGTADAPVFQVWADGAKFPKPFQSQQATAATTIDSSYGEYKNATAGVPLTTVEQFTRTFGWNGSDGSTINAALYARAFQSHATASHGGFSWGEYTIGEFLRMDVMGGVRRVGFFGATPVAKPTGVAVSDAAIHAALVSLGLIAA